jgi:GGDEF domain-containing protein
MVAAELQKVRGGGRAYRYGGEEFAILFPGSTPADASGPLEEVRAAIADRRFALRAPDRPQKKPDPPRRSSRPPRLISVSVSIGFAGPNARAADSGAVLRAADRALYRAKNKGRNRVVRYGVRSA